MPNSDVQDRTDLIWHLETDALDTVEETSIFVHAVGVVPQIPLFGTPEPITFIIEPGNRDASAAFYRMTERDPAEDSVRFMPPLASELPDTEGGLAAVGAWIDLLGAN